uniref:Uncharacterized protein n=1 Tax=Arion vulgaris TaxID=1028688 RepID=A0A0B7B3Z4_9EUPU
MTAADARHLPQDKKTFTADVIGAKFQQAMIKLYDLCISNIRHYFLEVTIAQWQR